MAQKAIIFAVNESEVKPVEHAIKASGLSRANFLRMACGLSLKKQGERTDINAKGIARKK